MRCATWIRGQQCGAEAMPHGQNCPLHGKGYAEVLTIALNRNRQNGDLLSIQEIADALSAVRRGGVMPAT